MMANPIVNLPIVRRVGLTVLAGVAWPFVCGMLFLHIGYDVLVLQIQLLQTLGIHSGTTLKELIQFTDAIFWSVLFGVMFGLPLAVLVRENVLRYWWLFFMTVLLLAAVGEVSNGVASFVTDLALSPFPVYQGGILVVWFITARTLSIREHDESQEAQAS